MDNSAVEEKIEELVIIGSGPAGLTAGIYASRADLHPLLIAGAQYGGQLMLTTEVENFPGFNEGVMGPQLIQNMLDQAKKFGTKFEYKNVTKVELGVISQEEIGKPSLHKVYMGDEEIITKSVIIASGARPRKIDVPGENEFWGKGVSSCATCDGAFYRGKTVAVVGGGDSAMEEANFLTKFASKVYLVHRRNEFRASKIMQDRAAANPKVEFILDTVIKEIKGELTVNGLVLTNVVENTDSEIAVDGLFLAIGYIPETELFKEYIDVSVNGYARPASGKRTMSKIEGVFIAGDVEDDHYRQAVTAAADGCKAALDAEKWLAEHYSH